MLVMVRKLFAKFICIILIAFNGSAFAASIVIGGTGNSLGTMRQLAMAYETKNPDISITVLPSIGSSGAIKAVPAGKIDIGLSSRPLKDAEMINGIHSVEYARSPTVIAVSNDLIVKHITIEQLVDVYSGVITQWPNGELIRPILRQANDDNTKQLRELSPALSDAILIADNRPGLLFAATDQETVDKIETTPGSFGVTCLALILSEARSIHPLSLNGIEPTIENSKNGSYLMTKQFHLILPEQIPTYVADFIAFIDSTEGEHILEQYGNYVPSKEAN